MNNLVIIFGAGASHDVLQGEGVHVCNENFRPPLTNGLFDRKFDDLVSDFGSLGELKPEIRGHVARDKSLEDFLKQKRDFSPNNKQIAAQLAGLRLYLKRLFFEISNRFIPPNNTKTQQNNYVSLLNHIKILGTNNPTLITFNYDLFLDRAIHQVFGREFWDINSYSNDLTSAKLFKVHGSVDWVYFIQNDSRREIESLDTAARWISNRETHKRELKGGGLFKDEEIIKIDEDRLSDYQNSGSNSVIAPALAIPLPSEKDFIIEAHRTLIAQELVNVSTVVVIGWSAGDEHFRKFMKEHIKEDAVDLFIIDAPNKSKAAVDNLSGKDAPKWKKITVHESGFSGFISDLNLIKQVFG